MNDNPRYLTKSRFKLGLECPSKLYFTKKPEYLDRAVDDPFLLALAKGGFQVGELAKAYFPDGVEIETRDYDAAVEQTNALLERDSVTIFEAAFRHENYFVLVDVLRKEGDRLEVIEVKSSSIGADEGFYGTRGGLDSGWEPYLYDVAFQKFVVEGARPAASVSAFLMLVDKDVPCPSDGLHQKFRLVRGADGRDRAVAVGPLDDDEHAAPILRRICVDEECARIFIGDLGRRERVEALAVTAARFADAYARDEFLPAAVSTSCKSCQFQAGSDDRAAGFLSGRHHCWKNALGEGWTDAEIDGPTTLDVWNGAGKLVKTGKLRLSDVSFDHLAVAKPSESAGMSRQERQWQQIAKTLAGDETPHVDRAGLAAEIASWRFPLHFIDFETATPAIPFNRGRRPYGMIAFQFSHHVVSEDGRVEHAGEYINDAVGAFPNFDFVRALKAELEGDDGTIFRYHNHENTVLCAIDAQLAESSEPDRDALRAFIRSITKSTGKSAESWEGPRRMVDLQRVYVNHFYHPLAKGSNSIKHVLPAVLATSAALQAKYAGANYGTLIPSRNFAGGKSWIERDESSRVKDPYKLLDKLFDGDFFDGVEDEELNNGGAAMTAYARLQFQDLPAADRAEIRAGLLRYCELDTLAMVMLYEALREAAG